MAFEFRIRARNEHKPRWIFAFWAGSLMTAFGQGMLLGRIATGYQSDAGYGWFALFVGLRGRGLCAAGRVMAGDAGRWRPAAPGRELARHAIRWTAVGMVAIAVTLGLANAGIFYKWSNIAHLSLAATVWVLMLGGFVAAEMLLARLPGQADRFSWLPFVLCVALFLLMLCGLAYSLSWTT